MRIASTQIAATCLALLLAGTASATADVLSRLQAIRHGGCGGSAAFAAPLEHLRSLDAAARYWAGGDRLAKAVEAAGYDAVRVSALHLQGSADLLDGGGGASGGSASNCRALREPALRHMGVYQRGADTWLLVAAPAYPGSAHTSHWREPSDAPRSAYTTRSQPPATPRATAFDATGLSERVLDLVNAARDSGRRCGKGFFPAVEPLHLSPALNTVAAGHASDMARRQYFEHVDPDGRSPADRVRAAGYRERLVGENIAYGPTSAEEVVAGWLASPGHCENIMDPRFSEMGLALAAGGAHKRGPYWVQLLVRPAAFASR